MSWQMFKWSEVRKNFLLNTNDPRNFYRYKTVREMKLEQKIHLQRYKYRIHPYSRFRVLWETFYCGYIVLNIMANFIFLTLSITPIWKSRLVVPLFVVGDIVLMVNIILNCITGVFKKGRNEAIMHISTILGQYFRRLFFIDLYALVVGSPAFASAPDSGLLFTARSLAIFLRVVTPWNYLNNSVSKYFLIDGLISDLIRSLIYLPMAIGLLCTLGYSVKLASRISYIGDNMLEVLNNFFTFVLGIWPGLPFLNQANLIAILAINSVYIFFSHLLYFIIATFIILILWSRRGSASAYNDLQDNLKQYLSRVKISERLKIRIARYYEEAYQGKFYSEPQLLEKVSSELKIDILSLKVSRMREEILALQMLPLNELLTIGKLLVYEVYFGNDVIAYSGTPHDRMYFIARGSVAMYTDNAHEIYHIPNRMHFLARCLLYETMPIPLNYLACETTTIYSLSRIDFLPVKDHCPVFTQLLLFTTDVLSDVFSFIKEKDMEYTN